MKQRPNSLNVVYASCQRLNKAAKGLIFAACFIGAVTPSICRAENGGTGLIVPVTLTELTALPDSAIAVVTGTGLQAPNLSGNTSPSAPIILWDELRPA